MADFETAIKYVLENEGSDSNDPHDSGGLTRFGIIQSEAKTHGFDITKLTLDQAKGIYKSDYWRFDDITDQRIATKLLDMRVNLGPKTAIILAQKVLGVSPTDGILGPITISKINSISSDTFLSDLVSACVKRYVDIVINNPSQLVFLNGWVNRAFKLP